MYFQLSAFLASTLRQVRHAYLWVTGMFLRLVFVVWALAFGTAIASIIVLNLGGSVFWQLGVFGLGSVSTLHFAMKVKKFMITDK